MKWDLPIEYKDCANKNFLIELLKQIKKIKSCNPLHRYRKGIWGIYMSLPIKPEQPRPERNVAANSLYDPQLILKVEMHSSE